MILKELRPGHFGKFHNQVITLQPGINIVYGKNEAGKSTLHSFIKGMFFGIERLRGRAGKEDIYTKYQPWETPGAFSGSMEFIYEEVPYRIERSFYQKEKSLIVTRLDTGREVKFAEGKIGDLVPLLTESNYRNTISIEQLHVKTDQELVNEVSNYIANLTTTKSNEVDVMKALASLNEKRKQLIDTQIQDEIAVLEVEIKTCLEDEVKLVAYSIQLKKLEIEYEDCVNQIKILEQKEEKEIKEKSSRLPIVLETYNQYVDIKESIANTEQKITQLSESCKKTKEILKSSHIKEQMKEYETLTYEKQQLEEAYHEKVKELEPEVDMKGARNKYIMMFPAIVGLILCGISIFIPFIPILLGVIVLIAGIFYYVIKVKKIEISRSKMDDLRKEYEKKVIHIQSLKKDILLENRVVDLENLRNKWYEITIAEREKEFIGKQFEENQRELKQLLEKKDRYHHEIMNCMKDYMYAPHVTKECMMELRDLINEKQLETKEKKEDLLHKERETLLEIEKLKWNMELLSNNEDLLLSKKQMIEEKYLKKSQLEQELEAVKLAIETIKELAVNIHDSFGKQLNELISDTVGRVTNGAYTDVTMDEKMNIKVLHNNSYVPLERLSAGTIEQVYLAIRLVVAKLFFRNEEMPVILDDAFVYYDDERTKAVLSYLSGNIKRQIILFTCHNRERRILDEEAIPYHYVEL